MFSAFIAAVPLVNGAAQAKSSSRCGSAAFASVAGQWEATRSVPLCASPHGALDVGVVEEQRTDPKRVRDCIHLQTASRWANVLPRISARLHSARGSPGAAD
jgi:hypothetical protein